MAVLAGHATSMRAFSHTNLQESNSPSTHITLLQEKPTFFVLFPDQASWILVSGGQRSVSLESCVHSNLDILVFWSDLVYSLRGDDDELLADGVTGEFDLGEIQYRRIKGIFESLPSSAC